MEKKRILILLFEDNPGDARLFREFLHEENLVEIELDHVERLNTGLEHLTQAKPDVILLDLGLPDSQGLETFTRVYAQAPNVPIVVLTGLNDAEQAVEAVKAGAQDYLVKGEVSGGLLVRAIRYAIERKQAEEILRDSEERFRSLYENVTVGMYRTTLDGRILMANPSMVRMLGFDSFEQLAQRNLEHEGHEPDHPRSQFLEAMEKHGEIMGLESAWRQKDGNTLFVRESARTIRDAQGQILYYDGTVEDITERKQAEDALAASEAELRTLFAGMNDVVIIYDIDGRYIKIAPTSPANLFRPLDEMLGKKIHDVVPREQADYIVSKIREAIQNDQVVNAEYAMQFDGKEIWFASSANRLSESTVIWVAHDISNRKHAEEKIQRQLEHLLALSGIDRLISSNFDLNLSLSEILAYVTKELGVDAADILLLNPGLQMLEFGAERGFRTKAIRNTQVRLGESYAGRAALERQLVQIPNGKDETDKQLFLTAHLAGEDFACYFGVPLIAKGQVKGVLEVFHRHALAPDAEWLDFLNTLAGQAAIAIENSTLFENLQRSNSELGMAYDATIEGWSHALDLRDKETEGHAQRVTEMTLKLARAFGLNEADLIQVRWGALLHDIGKMGVPDGILLKPGPLTDEEWAAMKKHPRFAYEMLSPIHYLRNALDIPYCHHEKWDGSGYPRGLKGAQIPLVARIFAVVDVYDALTSNRPYRLARAKEKALEHIREQSGKHFDPKVVESFLRLISDMN